MGRRPKLATTGSLYLEEETAARLAKILHGQAPQKMSVPTGQETAALYRAASEGPTLRADYEGRVNNYLVDVQAGMVTWQARSGIPHKVILYAREDQDMDVLLELCREQDTDTAYLATYLTNLLRPNGLTYNIDLYKTARAIGLRVDKMGDKEKLSEMRRIWRALRWLSTATVVGSRTGTYTEGRGKDKRVISTRVHAPLLQVVRWWMPDQPPLPGMLGEVVDEQYEALFLSVPRIVEVRLSEEWHDLISASSLGEFLEGIQTVMSLPGQQPSGAWARSIALALASLWRREAEHYLAAIEAAKRGNAPSILLRRLSRRALISDYRPTKAPLEQLLMQTNPARAVTYWAAALQELVGCGFLRPYGDASSVTEAELRRDSEGTPLGQRKEWANLWADSLVTLLPGENIEEALRMAIKKEPGK